MVGSHQRFSAGGGFSSQETLDNIWRRFCFNRSWGATGRNAAQYPIKHTIALTTKNYPGSDVSSTDFEKL